MTKAEKIAALKRHNVPDDQAERIMRVDDLSMRFEEEMVGQGVEPIVRMEVFLTSFLNMCLQLGVNPGAILAGARGLLIPKPGVPGPAIEMSALSVDDGCGACANCRKSAKDSN